MSTMTTAQPAPLRLAWVSIIWLSILHLGALLAFVPAYFSWSGLVLCLVLHWLSGGIGICLTYHRLLTHRSFALRPYWIEHILTLIGTTASEGGPISWVADHRRHHAHSDQEFDAHTPLKGFFWAHMGWFMKVEEDTNHTAEYLQKWAPDLYKDPVLRWIERYHILFAIFLMAALYVVGGFFGLGMSWLIWAGFLRTVLVLHSTWLVNSASHIWGYRSHVTRDKSTNLWWVALVTYGEGWHNNHHAHQTSARHGLRWWELDMTYLAIRFMQICHVAYNIRLPKFRTEQPLVAMASAGASNSSNMWNGT